MPPKELVVLAPTPQPISNAFRSYPTFSNRKEEDYCRKIVESLTLEELEEAGNTSYAYFSSYPKDNSFRANIALKLARKYLIAANLDFKQAKLNLMNTLNFRKERKINDLRAAFELSSSPEDNKVREHFRSQILGEAEKQIMYIRGYDKHNRAVLIKKERTEGVSDVDAFLNQGLYILERARACSEHASNATQDQIILVEDFSNGDEGCYPPLKVQMQIADILDSHYPGLLARSFFVNVPVPFKNVGWYVIKPFMSSSLVDGCRFVTQEELKAQLKSKGMKDSDNKLTSSVDMELFLNSIPFYSGYEDIKSF